MFKKTGLLALLMFAGTLVFTPQQASAQNRYYGNNYGYYNAPRGYDRDAYRHERREQERAREHFERERQREFRREERLDRRYEYRNYASPYYSPYYGSGYGYGSYCPRPY